MIMKKIIFTFFLFFLPITVLADEKKEVTFASCVDGDTANVLIDGEETKIRFLAIDTPETKHPTKGVEPFGEDASNYTCHALKNAFKIEIEYDSNSDKKDKYNRDLVWVFVDGKLLQEKLIELGYAKVAYLYGDYKYTFILKEKEEVAKTSKIGLWGNSSEKKISNLEIGILFVILFIFLLLIIFNKKYRKKTINKAKRKVKIKLKKELNSLLK